MIKVEEKGAEACLFENTVIKQSCNKSVGKFGQLSENEVIGLVAQIA